jgi:hypothetical protein
MYQTAGRTGTNNARKIVNVSEREKFLGPGDCEHHLTHSLADMVVRRRGGEDDDRGKTQQFRGE